MVYSYLKWQGIGPWAGACLYKSLLSAPRDTFKWLPFIKRVAFIQEKNWVKTFPPPSLYIKGLGLRESHSASHPHFPGIGMWPPRSLVSKIAGYREAVRDCRPCGSLFETLKRKTSRVLQRILHLFQLKAVNTAAKRNAHEHKIWYPVSFLFPV